MDLTGVLRACVQRWWVFLPIIALTAWLCADQYREATPQYTSTGVVVVQATDALQYTRGAQTDSGVVVTTPFGTSDGPRVLAGLLARALNTTTVREQLLPAGGAALSALRDVQSDTNVVTVTVVAGDAATAARSMTAVVKGSDEVAASIQRSAGVKDGQFLGAFDGGPVDPPALSYPDRVRGTVGIGLAGLLLAVLLSVVAHSLIRRRPKRSEKVRPTARSTRKRPEKKTGRKHGQDRQDPAIELLASDGALHAGGREPVHRS